MEAFQSPRVSLAFSYFAKDAAAHNAVTGRPSHQATRRNAEKAASLGIPIRAGVIDFGHVQEAIEDLKSIGVTKVATDRVRHIGRGGDKTPAPAELCGRCGQDVAAVSADGDVSPCIFTRWLSAGNVRQTPLADILRSPQMAAALATIPPRPAHGRLRPEPGMPPRIPALLLRSPELSSPSMTHAPLEPDLATLIEQHTGPILEAARTPRGFTSDYTGIIRAASGRVFVKAVRDPGRLASSLEREAAINPAVQHLSPALRWQARGHGWLALGFQHAPGKHASFTPGSPDLPAVTRAIDRIATITLPPVAQDWRESRYDRYANGTAALFAGGTLLHGDINPDNLLTGPDGDVTIVDWSWPTHGAAFIDPACLVIQLIAAGHTPPRPKAGQHGAPPGTKPTRSRRRVRRRHRPHAPAIRATRPRTLAQGHDHRRRQLGRAPRTGTSKTQRTPRRRTPATPATHRNNYPRTTFTCNFDTECTHGCSRHGRESSAPRCPRPRPDDVRAKAEVKVKVNGKAAPRGALLYPRLSREEFGGYFWV